jgi:CRP/FNR family cyclic AMP-dependent transcriptional regulator
VAASIDARARTLASVPLFTRLSPSVIAQLASLATEFEVPAGQLLIEANAKGSGMFVIEQGVVVVQTRAGRLELGPGEVIGELALLTAKGVRTARVQAKTLVRCLAVGRDDFCNLLLDEPRVAVALLEVLAERLAAAVGAER